MFGAKVFVRGGANSSNYIDTGFPGVKYKLHHKTLIQTFLSGCQQVACPSSSPSAPTLLMITEGRTCLPWIRQQPTHCSHSFISYRLKN